MRLGSAADLPGGSEGSVRAEINVTPLVDVCLVLLIIFMVVTPMLQQGVDVALPETSRPEKMPEGSRQLTLAINGDGSVFVGQDWVPKEGLLARLGAIRERSPDRTVVLKADARLPYREVRDVMRLVNEAGFAGVGLVTLREEQAGG